jgi:isocitrate/isopropylmalate dehydrogenase
VHVGSDWTVQCWTYPDQAPILNIHAATTAVAFSIAGDRVGAEAVKFARDLLRQVERFAAEAERLHAEQQAAERVHAEGKAAPDKAASVA